jgi:flagellar protein FliL
MRKLIMAVVLLLVLGGGGAGAYFYFFQTAEASVGEDGKPIEVAKEEKEESHEPASFVEMDALILPIVDNEGVQQVVSIVVALEVAGEANAAKVKAMAPRLKDAYIQDLYGVLNKHSALKDGVIQIAPIKERLNVATKKVMGDDTVHEVLLQVVQQRPI